MPGRNSAAQPWHGAADHVSVEVLFGLRAHADRLISPSASLAASYIAANAADAGRIEVISNGIDLEPFHGFARRRDGGPLRFLCTAYLGEHKGILDLLQAAALLTVEPDLVGGWSLTIAGDGHLRPELEAQIASGRFANAVTCWAA